MNKTFKVIFSKARNALMVVNEATGSVQAKGTKIVIATAITSTLLIGGSAVAAGVADSAVQIGGESGYIINQADKATVEKHEDGFLKLTVEGVEGSTYGAVNNNIGNVISKVNIAEGSSFNNNSSGSSAGALAIFQAGKKDSGSTDNIIVGSTFKGNAAIRKGGAIATLLESTVSGIQGSTTIADSTFESNKVTGATGNGGAVYGEQTAYTVKNSTFKANEAGQNGGAIYIESESSNLAVENSNFDANKAGKNGGAVYAENAFTVVGGQFDNNSAIESGGAIYSNKNATFTITGASFSKNSSEGYGGAIYSIAMGDNLVSGSVFSENNASRGGAINFWSDGMVTGDQSFTVENSKFVSNKAETKGGAIAWLVMDNEKDQVLSIVNTSFDANQAETGGAIHAEDNFTVVGSQFNENKATDDGGAIYAHTTADFAISDSSFRKNTSGDNGGAIAAWADNGQNQNYIVTNSQFIGNEATDKGGAISWLPFDPINDGASHNLSVENSTFDSNIAQWGGAINTEAELNVKDTVFKANTAKDDGGAIDASRTAQFSINGARFEQNTAGDNGGAINAWTDNQLEHNNTIANSQFIGNKATDKGGAISWLAFDPLWDDLVHNITVENSTFDNNSAQWGGAINTEGEITLRGETRFVGNVASQQGGAIFVSETGTLNVEGSAIFTNNTAANTLNDIHNEGTLNVIGSLTLDGGISGEGTTNFGENSSLNVHVGFNQSESTIISNNVVVADGASLGFIFAPGYMGKYELFTGDVNGVFQLEDNNTVFDVTLNKDGSYQVSQKSTDAIAASTGANANQSRAIRAILGDYSGSNETFNAIAESVALGIQSANASDQQAALNAVTALSTEAAPVIAQTQIDSATQVYAAVGSRFKLTNNQEPSSHLWVQGLLSTGDYDDNGSAKGYDTDSNGIAFGLDSAITDSIKIGVGFAYTDTDIDGFLRDIDVESKTAFIYGQYKPSNWYVNGIMSYGWSSYDESKYVAGFNVGADYDVETFGVQVMTGYDFEAANFNVTPEVGLRYFHISQDGYTDAAGSFVASEDNDVLTALIGAKVNRTWDVSPSVVIKPQARVAMTYDLVDADNNSVITLANGASYRVNGETMDRFGVEVDVGVSAEVTDNFEFALTYSGNFRGDFQNHAGLINAKYKF